MSYATDQGYGNYEPPKQEKRHPLTRQDTERMYQAACEFPDTETELAVRVPLDFGLRNGELAHSRAHWVNKEYQTEAGREIWRINVPRIEYCWGGKGDREDAQFQNKGGLDLHDTNSPCGDCVNRSWGKKVAPEGDKENGWITEDEAEEYDFSPKTRESARKVWQFPGLEECEETAEKLRKFLEAQPHEQWPHVMNSIRSRVQKVADRANLELPDRPHEKVVPHALRHTYGCRLVEMNVGEGAGMKLMRHKNADVFRWYSDVRGSRVVSALTDAVSENDSLLHE